MWKKNPPFQSPEEIRRRKNIKKGIEFALLICGQEGTGKAAFINSLCNQQVIRKDTSNVSPDNAHLNPGMDIVKIHVNIAEKDSTPISLDIIMTPGFGDNIDNKSCTDVMVNYLEQQFELMLNEECRIDRDAKFKDGRPHALLYFIRATSRGLREMEVKAMKKLSTMVNVIPVIAKLDSLTVDELNLNKLRISRDINLNKIQVYDFSIDSDDPETMKEVDFLRKSMPFAVSGSYETEEIDGETYHVRRYPWGVLRVESPEHSEFTSLRNVLFGSHLQELKEATHAFLYENYRRAKLGASDSRKSRRFSTENPRVVSMSTTNNTLRNSFAMNGTAKPQAFFTETSILNLFNNLDASSADEATLGEIEKQKKLILTQIAELRMYEERLRVCSKPRPSTDLHTMV